MPELLRLCFDLRDADAGRTVKIDLDCCRLRDECIETAIRDQSFEVRSSLIEICSICEVRLATSAMESAENDLPSRNDRELAESLDRPRS